MREEYDIKKLHPQKNSYVKGWRFNAETEAAMVEAGEIAAGHIATKRYRSVTELMRDVDAEEEG